jgi:hypothetical protein
MKAVGLYKHLPVEDPQSLVDLDIQQPNHPTGHDLLVAIKAISSSIDAPISSSIVESRFYNSIHLRASIWPTTFVPSLQV